MKDLYVGGYDTTGPPTVIDNVKIVKTLAAPINGAPPSVMTLAQLSKDVYNNPSDQQGAPDGNMTKLPYNEKGAEGFQASVYFNSTTNQIVVAVRGTKDGKLSAHPGAAWKNTAADIALTPNGELNPLLTSYVEQLSKLVLTVSQDHPGIPVTLTGHSLGGAVAQIVGAIKNVDTISFDAPGSSNLLFQKISDTQTLSQLVQANIPNAVTTNSGLMKTAVNIVNYRLQGDVVSLSGYDDSTGTSTQEGQTITVKNPLIVDDSGIGGASYPGYLDNHELSNLIGAMQQYCPDGTPSLVGFCNKGFNDEKSALIPAVNAYRVACDLVNGTHNRNITDFYLNNFVAPWFPPSMSILCAIADPVVHKDLLLVDPDPASTYFLYMGAGSPYISEFQLPQLLGIDGWGLQYHDQNGWSTLLTQLGLADFLFNTDVDELSFTAIDKNGNLIFNPNYFNFNIAFASDGTANINLLEYGVNTDQNPVPEPSTLYLVGLVLPLVCAARRRRAAATTSVCM